MSSDIAMKMLLVFAAASFPAWFLLFAGIGTRRDIRPRKEKELARTTGRIAEYVRKERRTGRNGRYVYYVPIVEYEAGFLEYRKEYENQMDPEKHPVGKVMEILYDAHDPTCFHLAEDPVFTDPGGGAIRIALLWIALSAALAFTLAILVGGVRFDLPDLDYLWFRVRRALHFRRFF